MVYQDDILFTAIEIAGYTWESVDKLRKAVGKKIPEEMKRQEKIFIEGCQKHSGLSKEKAEELWSLFVPFQGYGFNKAHAAAYGIVAYQTAYMKANYPVEYMTAVLTAEADNTDKVVQAIEECARMKIPVLPPDINTSETNFTIVDHDNKKYKKAIRFGLSAIKNVGTAAIESIIAARTKLEEFKSLSHFAANVDGRKVNKKVYESLIKVGTMDAFGSRAALLEGLDDIRNRASRSQDQLLSGQSGLFDAHQSTDEFLQDKLPDVPEFPKAELLSFEKLLLGLYLTEHPMAKVLTQIAELVSHKLSDLDNRMHSGRTVTLGGIVTSVRTTYTKKSGAEMAFAKLEDQSGGTIDIVFFPRIWEEVKTMVQKDQPIIVNGKLDLRDEELNLLASKVKLPNTSQQTQANHILEIPRGTDKKVLQEIGAILKQNQGEETMAIVVPGGNGDSRTIMLPYKVSYTDSVKAQVQALLT